MRDYRKCDFRFPPCDSPAVTTFLYESVKFGLQRVPYCAEHYDKAVAFHRENAETEDLSLQVLKLNGL